MKAVLMCLPEVSFGRVVELQRLLDSVVAEEMNDSKVDVYILEDSIQNVILSSAYMSPVVIIDHYTGENNGIRLNLGGTCLFEIDPVESGDKLNMYQWIRQFCNGFVELEFTIDEHGDTKDFKVINSTPSYMCYSYLKTRIDRWKFSGSCFYGKIRMRFDANSFSHQLYIDDSRLVIAEGFDGCDKVERGRLHWIRINSKYVVTDEIIKDPSY